MATTRTVSKRKSSRTPIARAAERAGLTPQQSEEFGAEKQLQKLELAALRRLVSAAELAFEFNGEVGHDPSSILREALRSACDDIGQLGAEHAPQAMAFTRAQYRCELALALFEYRSEFGFPDSDAANGVEVSP